MQEGESAPLVELVELRFSGRQALSEMLAAALPACAALALPGDEAPRLNIVVEELLANVLEHGGLAADGEIRLALRPQPGGVELVLEDSGLPFDPRGAASAGEVPDRGGGAGLNIVRQWAAILSYRPGPPRNRLELRMPRRERPGGQPG